jgi:ribonuclease D
VGEGTQAAEQIVSRPEDLPGCCEVLAGCPVVGFDTEFVGEDSYHPRLCLIQVATPETLYLIDPLSVGPLDAFWELLVDPGRQVVVHAAREDLRICQLGAGKPPANLFDIQIAAGLIGLGFPMGHGMLVNQLLRVHLSKGETLTEWRNRPLTKSQIRYAFDDVRYLLALRQKLTARLDKLGRLGWIEEECERLKKNALTTPTESERFRKLRGLGSLDRRKLAVVRDLYAWREERAAQTNRPARTIVRDDLLVEIAKRNPTSERDLQVVRGLAKRDLGAIVEVVEKARTLPPGECPELAEREMDPPQVQLVTNILTAFVGDWCARHRVAQSLAASSTDVKLLVRSRLQGAGLPGESMLTRGWRAEHLLPEVLAMLDGRRALRIADVASETPFAFEETATPATE